jgi:hypothetical protein
MCCGDTTKLAIDTAWPSHRIGRPSSQSRQTEWWLPAFHRTSTFREFNNILAGNGTSIGTIATPASLHAAGPIRRDSKMQRTALFAGEAVADAGIVTTLLKATTKRVRPTGFPPKEAIMTRGLRAAARLPLGSIRRVWHGGTDRI